MSLGVKVGVDALVRSSTKSGEHSTHSVIETLNGTTPEPISDTYPLSVRQVGFTTIKTTQLNVGGAAATPIPATAQVGRRKILIVNLGSNGTLWLGDNSVTAGNGIPVLPYGSFEETLLDSVVIYGISDSVGVTCDTRVMEKK